MHHLKTFIRKFVREKSDFLLGRPDFGKLIQIDCQRWMSFPKIGLSFPGFVNLSAKNSEIEIETDRLTENMSGKHLNCIRC